MLLVFLLVLLPLCSYSWNALGHMVIAQIAYDQLNPNVKTKVDKMIADLSKEYPYNTSFYQLGPWADYLRIQKIDIYSHWHYVDLPFSKDGTPLKNLDNTDNIVWAIDQIEPIIANPKANAFERARFLAFLVHVVGDIHQPLHTTSRISVKNPDGDQGGNLYFVKFPASHPKTIPLHKLWDQGIDIFTGPSTSANVVTLSNEITSLYPKKYFDVKITDLKAINWAQEGFQNVTTVVYSTPENQLPSEAYLQTSRQLVQEEVALAGYRLAAVLNQLLD